MKHCSRNNVLHSIRSSKLYLLDHQTLRIIANLRQRVIKNRRTHIACVLTLHFHLTVSHSVPLYFSFSSCAFSVCHSVGRSACRHCESLRAPFGLAVVVASWRLPRPLPPSTSGHRPCRCPGSCGSCARLS